jgi:hypothetical protein
MSLDILLIDPPGHTFNGAKIKLAFYLIKKSFIHSLWLGINTSVAIFDEFIFLNFRKFVARSLDCVGLKTPVRKILEKLGWL